jgi:hypothetical protein
MASLVIVPFAPMHYVTAAVGTFPYLSVQATAESLARNGPAFTGLIDGTVATVAGLQHFPWPGVAEAWAIVTPIGRQHGLVVSRQVARHLGRLIHAHDYRRVQADVVAAFTVGRVWVEWLGFTLESIMVGYGPEGVDMARYVWLRPPAAAMRAA